MTENASAFPSAPGDTLLFENDRVRVWSMTLGPNGGMYDFHAHHHDHVIIWPDPGRAQGQTYGDEDWGITQTAEAGFVMFKTVGSEKPLKPHRIRNLEDHAVTHFVVELLGPSPSTTELQWDANERGGLEL